MICMTPICEHLNNIEQIIFLNKRSVLRLNFSYLIILTKKKDKIFKYLGKNQIVCQIFPPKLLSNTKLHKTISVENFHNAKIFRMQIIQLVIFAYHKALEIKYIIKHGKFFFKNEKN